MKHFRTYLQEDDQGSKNLHLEHLEDQMFNRGIDGAVEGLNFLHALRDMFSGHSTHPINITTKWDGSPSVVVGINPDNGKFFVGTKSVFTSNPKLNYTEPDIDRNHEEEDLREKLKACLRYLPKLGIQNILQGDLMFTNPNKKVEGIAGEKYVTFTPNVITYAVPLSTTLAANILRAAVGIVFHTEYHGPSMATLSSSFNVDLGYLTHSKDVWFRDASFVDQSGTATFTEQELKELDTVLSLAESTLGLISSKTLNQVSLNITYRNLIKVFNNTKVRAGTMIGDTTVHTNELIQWIEGKYTEELRQAKLEATQKKRIQERTIIVGFFRAHAPEIRGIFNLQNLMISAKMIILRKLGQVQDTQTFMRTSNGLKVTGPEGFVAIDKIGNAVKLVDRMTFSHANFTVAKDWK